MVGFLFGKAQNKEFCWIIAVFSQIGGSIANAASGGIVIDPMGAMFDLVSMTGGIQVSKQNNSLIY